MIGFGFYIFDNIMKGMGVLTVKKLKKGDTGAIFHFTFPVETNISVRIYRGKNGQPDKNISCR